MASPSFDVALNDRQSSLTKSKTTRPRRAIRPCDLCRIRKSRCVIPPGYSCCMICQSRQTPCTFDRNPPPRPSRLQPGKSRDFPQQSTETAARSRKVHRNLAPNTREDQGALAQPNESNVRSAVDQSPTSSFESSYQSPLPPGTMTEERDVEVQSSQDIIFAHASRRDREDNDGSLGLAKSSFAELYGLTSDMEPILMRHRPYDAQSRQFRLDTHSIRRVLQEDMGMQYPVTFHVVKDDKAIGYQNHFEQDAIERCVAPYGPSLIDLFWKIVHPCYPILHKGKFIERYSTSYREIDAPLLGAVYLISLNWWTYDRELSNKPAPNGSLLRDKVIKTIQNSYHRPKLSSIEATLLLVQCKPEDALNPDHTWTRGYTSQALAIGEALGLHLDASSWEIPGWERGLRKRLSWALYMQDKWTALMHGRPSHIHDDNWGVEDIEDSDFYDLDENKDPRNDDVPMNDIQAGRRGFMEMVTLSKILSTILTDFFSLRASKSQDTVELYQRAFPVIQKLRIWYENVPHSLRMDRQVPRRLCANGFLHLSYHSLVLTLMRRIIRSTALAPLCSHVGVLNDTRKLASDSAEAAMAFVRILRPDHLEAFWFFSSGFNFSLIGSFVTLLLVTSHSEAEKAHWRERLNDYLWSLRIMGKGNEPMRYAVNRLEGAILRGMEHALAVQIAPAPAEHIPNDQNIFLAAPFPQQSLQFSSPNHQICDMDMSLHPAIPSASSQAPGDWLTPFISEDISNLNLKHFDWLAEN